MRLLDAADANRQRWQNHETKKDKVQYETWRNPYCYVSQALAAEVTKVEMAREQFCVDIHN